MIEGLKAKESLKVRISGFTAAILTKSRNQYAKNTALFHIQATKT
jgi:hypothetical protein